MSMVKAYHGKQCTDLQLCCSNWRESNSLSKNDLLTKDIEMGEEEDENWLWDSTSRKSLSDNERQESDQNLNQSKYLPLDPPVEFQDNPTTSPLIDEFADDFISKLIADVLLVSCKITWSIPCSQDCHMSGSLPLDNSALWNGLRLCWTPELLPYNKSQNNFPGCLSASHNSLSTIGSSNIDETAHIKSALSHDALTTNEISDMYNVPFDSDIYSVPVDQISKTSRSDKWSFRNKCWASPVPSSHHYFSLKERNSSQKLKEDVSGRRCIDSAKKSHRSSDGASSNEPIHVTVEEVRQYLRTLYSRAGNEGSENRNFQDTIKRLKNPFKTLQNHNNINQDENRFLSLKVRSKYIIPARSKKAKENVDTSSREYSRINERFKKANACRPSFSTNIKETLCNIFRIKRLALSDHCLWRREPGSRSDEIGIRLSGYDDHNPPSSPITKPPFSKRALPPLPKLEDNHGEIIVTDSTPLSSPQGFLPPRSTVSAAKRRTPVVAVDFASSIEKVKDYGWYWGPISGEEAEKILSNEPDGSFIVRDSSDDYYIFSLTFKLNSIIRHVRIEHDQGNFSFGSSRFKSHTIVDFIESAVEHSRSGRYLFFLHRRPVLGPMRVQLLHPVSRFKQVQSLQHKCRFVILKMVRRDLIQKLPLPKRLLDYLSSPHYYSEHLVCEDQSDSSSSKDDLDQLLSSDQEGFS